MVSLRRFSLGKRIVLQTLFLEFFICIIKLKSSFVQLQVARIIFSVASTLRNLISPQGSVFNQDFPLLVSCEMHSS